MPQVTMILPATWQATDIRRVAAYCRVSSDSKQQLLSCASQVRIYTAMINSRSDWQLVEIFVDEGIPGTSTEKRTEFQRMITMCENHEIDLIITKSISRFARNVKDALEYVRKLKLLGVEVLFEKEGISTFSLGDEMLLNTFAAIAQEESVAISQNLRLSIRKRMEEGIYNNSHAPYGYDYNSGLVISEPEATVVRRIFDEYSSGKSTDQIARELNEEGIKTSNGNTKWWPSMKGRRNTLFGYKIINGRITVFEDEAHTVRRIFEMYANGYSLGLIAKTLTAEHIKYYDMVTRWDKTRILRILVNEKYIGIDSYPMIVTKEEFNAVAKIKATRSPKVMSSPCSGGKETVLCEVCGSKMIVRTPHSRKALQCKNCGIYIYLSSNEISDRLQNIYEFVASKPYLLIPRERPQVMAMKPNIQLYELKRLLAQTNVNQDEALSLISDIAKIEYNASNVGSDILARRLRNRIKRESCDGSVTTEFIKEYVDRVCMSKCGNIILYMTTGVQISERSFIDGSHKNPEKNGEPA